MSKIKMLTDLVPGESPLSGSQRATFWLCRHVVEEARKLWSLFYNHTNPIHENSTQMSLITSPRLHLLIPSFCGVRISTYDLRWRAQTFSPQKECSEEPD